MDRPERLLTPPFVFTIVAELGVFLTIGMLLPVLPVYAKDELGAGSIGIGIAVAAVSPTALLFQPLVGQLGDRRGRRLLVVSGPLVVAGTVASYTFASSLWVVWARLCSMSAPPPSSPTSPLRTGAARR